MKSMSVLILIIVLFASFKTMDAWSQGKDISDQNASPAKNYYLISAKKHLKSKEYDKAFEELELALLLDPDNVEAKELREKTHKLIMEKKEESAIENYDKKSPKKPAVTETEKTNIANLMKKVNAAIQNNQYDEATEILDFILNRDPYNIEALYTKEKLNEIKYESVKKNLGTTHSQEMLKNYEYLKELSVPYHDTLRFPVKKQWKKITRRELPELDNVVEENKTRTELLRLIPNPSENHYSQKVEDALNTIISFEFIDTSLQDIVAFLREKTKVNIILDPGASAHVTLKLDNVTVRTALKYILPKGYEYFAEGDIIHIYRQKMELRVYDVRDILINLADKEPLEFDITAAVSSQLSISRGEPAKIRDTAERVLDLIEMIVTSVEPSSWSANVGVIGGESTRSISTSGLGSGTIVARAGQPGDLIIVNTTYVHKQIEDLLASLRTSQNIQVNIEARFITVTDDFLEDIGTNIEELFSDNTSTDTGAEEIVGELGSGIDLNFAIFGNSELRGFLRAVQESKGSEVLTSPRITLSNTQRGNIAVLQTINYVQSTSVEDGIVTPVIGTVPEGTTFDVRPIVSTDRKFVYLEVTPSVFDVAEIEEFTFSGLTEDVNVGGGGDGTTFIPPEQTVQLPKVDVSQVSVTVCVPDRGTLMIGGLGSLNKEDNVTGIPILSKIPFLKRLFSRSQKTRNKSNLIILLKPTIIIKEEQEKLLELSNRKPVNANLRSKK